MLDFISRTIKTDRISGLYNHARQRNNNSRLSSSRLLVLCDSGLGSHQLRCVREAKLHTFIPLPGRPQDAHVCIMAV
jgi:hypothetical protein